jgi:DNA-binding NtrC family response regulator
MPILAGGGSKVLIVDDEVPIADSLAMIFAAKRFEVRAAYSAEQAVDIISVWHPDLAILDVILPRMNGIDLAILIRSSYPSCRIILFSGNANTAPLLEEAAKKGHSFDVLAKPTHPDILLEAATSMVSLEHVPNEQKFD